MLLDIPHRDKLIDVVTSRIKLGLINVHERDDPKSFESTWGTLLLLMDRIEAGNFHGVVEVKIKGPVVLTLRTTEQTFDVASEFTEVYDAVADKEWCGNVLNTEN